MTTTPESPEAGPAHLLRASEEYWEDEALPALAEFVRIPCLSPEFDARWEEGGHLLSAARLLAGWAGSRPLEGVEVEIVGLEGRTPMLYVEVPASGEGGGARSEAPVLFYGHLDKQPALGSWREGLAPFEPVREGDCLYGRGTADDGYSLFAALGAVELAERAGLAHRRCVILIEASEESGSPDLAAYLDELRPRFGADGPRLAVCLDSGATTYDRLWATTSLRGIVSATLKVSVLEEEVHSGAGGGAVPDSFRLLRRLLSRIEDEATGEILLDATRGELPPGRRAEAEELAAALGEEAEGAFPVLPGLSLAGGAGAAERLLAVAWGSALAVTGADGLPAVADASNVIRPFTAARLALRVPPSADAAAVAGELERRLVDDPPEGAKVEVLDLSAARGFDAPETAPWLTAALDEASLACYGVRAGSVGEGGTIPFLNELLSGYPEAQYLVTGVLGPGSNAHGPNEMLHVPTAKRLTAAIAQVLSLVP